MIKTNFHTHTTRCHHAFGTEREYIEAAIEEGIEELGFSDHCPIPFKSDYVSGIRMTMDEAKGYVECIRTLAKEYADKIKIYVGFECEYVPEFFEEQMELFDSLDVDYLIMGEHFIESEESGRYTGHLSDDYDYLKRYVDMVIEGMETGRYAYIAHPDIINFAPDVEAYKREMRRLCIRAKELDIPLEVNALGLKEGKQYPNDDFWDIVAEVGNKAIIGMDAHEPEMLKNEEAYLASVAILEARGITQITKLLQDYFLTHYVCKRMRDISDFKKIIVIKQ